jgi:aspartyl protease family protein
MLFWPVLIILLAVLAVLLSEPPADEIVIGNDMRVAYLAVLAAALAIVGAGRLLLDAGRRATLQTAIWAGAIAGVVTAFIFREDAAILVQAIRGELVPSVALSRTSEEAELRRGWDGHYRAKAEVNGVELTLMVDTGASMVLIPYEEAAAIGFDTSALEYSMPVTTANGRSSVAPVRLASIRLGAVEVYDIPAAIAQPERLRTGLLGMSFLDRLAETTFRGDKLILRQHQLNKSSSSGSHAVDR